MIVFRDYRDFKKSSHYIEKIKTCLETIQYEGVNYSSIVTLFIEAAELETGIADVISSGSDDLAYQIDLFHNITVASAEMMYDLWTTRTISYDQIQNVKQQIEKIGSLQFPDLIPHCIPEGFAFYGLYPEMYLESAIEFYEKKKPHSITCIGLRTIGTPLCAIVEVVLRRLGCDVLAFTLRPKGHPFERYVEFSVQIRQSISMRKDGWFAVIDEGPGLSGSSICGTLEKLLECGISKDRIVIFPSWNPDSGRFISERAKRLWPIFDKFTKDFTDVWIVNNKLGSLFEKKIISDFSGGNWRDFLISNKSDFPAVYTFHERRKYLLEDEHKNQYIAKWVGLGEYGEKLIKRGSRLAGSQFGIPITSYTYGFIIQPFIKGKILQVNDVNGVFLEFVANYFHFLDKNFRSSLTAPFEKMIEMIHINITEGLGQQYEMYLKSMDNFSKETYESNIVAIDGKVMPYEWVSADGRYYKIDQLEHCSDQFFPGPQNIAWDIAAFCIEFDLDEKQRNEFINTIMSKNGDRTLIERMRFYEIAYLAYRLGYVSVAADSLSGTADGDRFTSDILKYKRKILKELTAQ